MTNYDTTQEKGSVRPKYIPLGVDELGNHHVYRTDDETIHVVNDGQRHHVETLLHPWNVDEWMKHVDDKYGWADREYASGFAAIVEDALA